MAITTLDDFKKYCLRSLGAPVVNIDVTDEQIQDRYDDSLRKFQDHHVDATERTYLSYQLTSTDITNKYITIPSYITGISRVLANNIGAAGSSDANLFSVQYQFLLNEMHKLWSTSEIAYYEHTMQHLTMLDQILNGKPTFRFNRVIDRLYIDIDWAKKMRVGQYIVMECYRAIDPVSFVQMFDNMWFKKYTTAQIKRQWGENLKKFGGVQMMGGTVLNGQAIWQEAMTEISVLEQELRTTWEEPPEAIFIG